jgi:hypothetical protein
MHPENLAPEKNMYATIRTSGDWLSREIHQPFGEDVVELSLLLSVRQAETLEAAAHARGLTIAQLVRRLIQGLTDGANPGS